MINEIVNLTSADIAQDVHLAEALVALNNAHEVELSRLNKESLRALISKAFLARRIGMVEALLIALEQCAEHDGLNFLWFKSRMKRFIYVDRIVVGDAFRGRGNARRLYQDLFEAAGAAGHDRIVCEVNARPPNPGSDRFHANLGFEEVGMADLPGGEKTVRYLMRYRPR